MADSAAEGRVGKVRFTGDRGEMFGILTRGYLMMLPTLGVYRFWLVTWKRRFYWSHTEIDGDALEYTGHAMQLLIGFLFALAFFLPLYLLFFYLSTQRPEIIVAGYAIIGVLLWFFMGYALYRARDFRLSRTLWRGIRFAQKGSAWSYAIRRFFWSILTLVTMGLAYPFMSASLSRYKTGHTWYGDRQFTFDGSWKLIAGRFYGFYFTTLAVIIGLVVYIGSVHGFKSSPRIGADGIVILLTLAAMALPFLGYFAIRAAETGRVLSAIRCGAARVTVKLSGLTLLWQFVVYVLMLSVCVLLFSIIAGVGASSLILEISRQGSDFDPADFARIFQSSIISVIALALGYMVLLASFAAMAELYLSLGFWKAVANGTTIENVDSLRSVRAGAEDTSLAGEGLADALNVGAY